MIYEVKFPPGLDIADSVLTPPVPAADGCWYFSIYGKLNSPDAKAYCYRWTLGMALAEPLTLEEYTRKRGTLAVGVQGQHLWQWSFREDKTLIVQIVPDWAPPAWMTPGAALEAHIAAIDVRLTKIEAALGNASAPALDPKDREALDRLRRMLGL